MQLRKIVIEIVVGSIPSEMSIFFAVFLQIFGNVLYSLQTFINDFTLRRYFDVMID